MEALCASVAENWLGILYIVLTTVFSICFLRERRTESSRLREMIEQLEKGNRVRFDELERLVQPRYQAEPISASINPESRRSADHARAYQ